MIYVNVIVGLAVTGLLCWGCYQWGYQSGRNAIIKGGV